MWLQFIKCLINCKVNWTINSPAYMTLMIRCHGSPPLFTLFRPIAAHRTVSILEKKKLSPALLLDHIPAWTMSFQIFLSYWPAKLYRVFYDMFIDSRCFYKAGFRTSFSHFTSCQWITFYLILLTWVTFSVFQELQA